MSKKLFFPLIAVLLLMPWPVAYAYDDGSGGTGVVEIEVAELSAAPRWTAFGSAIGGVDESGDLFYVNASHAPDDLLVTLYFTNTDEIMHYYRYLNLQVGVYAWIADRWEPAVGVSGKLIPDTYLTMRNGMVCFTLPGYTKYKVTIESGCFYCFRADVGDGSVSPKFYLTVE